MTNRIRCFGKTLGWCLVSAALIFSVWTTHADNKLSPAEVIAKHLDAIGSAEARAQVHAMQLKGTSTVIVKQGGAGQVDGPVVMVSQGNQNLINMTFDAADYPQELLKYDGKKFTASQIRPGVRSSLEVFFMANDILFKEGLIGGTLSASWPLLDLQQKNPKLEYAGLKKIDGKQLQALKYTPRKGSDLKITLFLMRNPFNMSAPNMNRRFMRPNKKESAAAAAHYQAPLISDPRMRVFRRLKNFPIFDQKAA